MHESPRTRRLRNDLAALERLADESSVFRFKASGNPPVHYSITFTGKGLCRDHGKIKLVHAHQVEIKLGASYPRTIHEIRWVTPIYHPNVSEIGMVCLGGYGTHWVPSVQLDELCTMLWDMVRYHNYDIRSPYNRDAALWVANQTSILFPTDNRPIRDLRVALGRLESNGDRNGSSGVERKPQANGAGADRSPIARVRQFIERYGRVFDSDGSTPAPAPRGETRQEIEPIPLLEPVASLASEPAREPSDASPTPPIPAVPAEAPVAPHVPVEDGFVFLEDEPGPPPASPRRAAVGEDILFIE